jgi:hypothetical protein
MADVDHPKTHVEDQDLEAPRKQPESPQHEGIDPLTESDTMYPAENTKDLSEKLSRKEEKRAAEANKTEASEVEETVADQKAVKAKENKVAKDTAEKESTGSADTTDHESGEENTSPSNKTVGEGASDEVKAAEKTPEDVKADRPSETPKSGTAGSKTS